MPLAKLVTTSTSRIVVMIQSVHQGGSRDAQEGRKYWQMGSVKLALLRWRGTLITLGEAAEYQFVKVNSMLHLSLNVLSAPITSYRIHKIHQNVSGKSAQLSKSATRMVFARIAPIISLPKIMPVSN